MGEKRPCGEQKLSVKLFLTKIAIFCRKLGRGGWRCGLGSNLGTRSPLVLIVHNQGCKLQFRKNTCHGQSKDFILLISHRVR